MMLSTVARPTKQGCCLIKTHVWRIQTDGKWKRNKIKDNLKESIKDLEKMQDNFKKWKNCFRKNSSTTNQKELENCWNSKKNCRKSSKKTKRSWKKHENQEEFQQPDPEVLEKQERMQELMKKPSIEQQELMDKRSRTSCRSWKEDHADDEPVWNEQWKFNKDMKRLLELYKQLEMEKEVKNKSRSWKTWPTNRKNYAQNGERECSKKSWKKNRKSSTKMEDIEKKDGRARKKNKELSPPRIWAKTMKKNGDIKTTWMTVKELNSKSGDNKKRQKKKRLPKKMKKWPEMESSMSGGEMEQQTERQRPIQSVVWKPRYRFLWPGATCKDIAHLPTTPYVDLVKQQFKIKSDFSVIEDSLSALLCVWTKSKVSVTEKSLKSNTTSITASKAGRKANQQGHRKSTQNHDQSQQRFGINVEWIYEGHASKWVDRCPVAKMCNKPGGKGEGKSGGKGANG